MDAGVAERDDTYMLVVVVVVVVDRYRVVSWDRCVSPGCRPRQTAHPHKSAVKADCCQGESDPATCFLGDPEDVMILHGTMYCRTRLTTVKNWRAVSLGQSLFTLFTGIHQRAAAGRDRMLEDWPQPRRHLEDNDLSPWPRVPLALALASNTPGLGLGLEGVVVEHILSTCLVLGPVFAAFVHLRRVLPTHL